MTYTDDELIFLASLPPMIGAAAASASASGIFGTGKELFAIAGALLEGLKTYPNNSLIRQLLPNSDDPNRTREWIKKVRYWTTARLKAKGVDSAEKLRGLAIEDARAAATLLAAKASSAEAREYTEWAVSVGERVAQAAVEGGFLGFGGERVTAAERALIDQVKLAFDASADEPIKAGVVPVGSSTEALPLAGCKVIITAGPTHEPIVRDHYIAKPDSAEQGYRFAEAAVALGAETVLVSGPVNLPLPPGAQLMLAETALHMLKISEHELPCDIAICAAQVSEWRLSQPIQEGGSTDNPAEKLELELVPTPDIVATIAKRTDKRPTLVVGCITEKENAIENGRKNLSTRGCDFTVVRDVSLAAESFTSDRDTVHLISDDNVETWPRLEQREIADRLMKQLAAQLLTRQQKRGP